MDHTIVHFEIPADNIENSKNSTRPFSAGNSKKYPGPTTYYLVETVPVDENMNPIRSGTNGGLYCRKDAQSPDMAQQMNYIGVESIDEYSKKIEKLGGKIKFPKMEIKGLGWWAWRRIRRTIPSAY